MRSLKSSLGLMLKIYQVMHLLVEFKDKLSNPVQPQKTLDWNNVATKKIKEVSL